VKALESELNNRTLRFDGVSLVPASAVSNLFALGVKASDLRITLGFDDEEIQSYNDNVPEEHKLKESVPEPLTIDSKWQLPQRIKDLSIDEHIVDVFSAILSSLHYTEAQEEIAFQRIADELNEISKRGMTEFIKTIVYVLQTFKEKNLVWGVGRGSSCACYILFILGLHLVDCVKLDVPMEEFFHD
jgi:DNA polymerase III alpha subunit